ncbi:MAG: M1 family metallopeptidase [Bacteroidota bacterium]|nr:M1 family metallopeptidase [Bacteroidota bacterium]
MSRFVFVLLFAGFSVVLQAQVLHQPKPFTHQDTLRGSLNAERTWWDVQRYDITVTPDYAGKTIEATCIITFKVVAASGVMQVDLQSPLEITSAKLGKKSLSHTREGNVFHVKMPKLQVGDIKELQITYHGKPKEAIRPPWDGGWIWKKDAEGNPWMSVACQGLGASVWYPCKDYQGDEPDLGASLTMVVPDSLVAVGNGRLKSKKSISSGKTAWTWEVVNPINNYNIIPYIGKYVNFTTTYKGLKGDLDCSYWVLAYNLEKAKKQFEQATRMLSCFEAWFGPYPFYEDGYKLVESPHLGMEHQSAVGYGNGYQNGYLGRDLSHTGWGLKWDFIIVHESGHEWFGNNITTNDVADMWVHEGFTNYSETLFTECQFGKEAGSDYVIGTRKNISNDKPIIGPYGVNMEGSGDMYYKGGNMLHTIRQVINNDSLFRSILQGLNKTFYHQTVTSAMVEQYISQRAGFDFSKVFDQYLRNTQIPVLEYLVKDGKLKYRWTNCVNGFNLPVKSPDVAGSWLRPTTQWQELATEKKDGEGIGIDRNFYVQGRNSAAGNGG